jgi:ring-1,2-phenylacetyl-CoA epoxidase subunit PaaC
MSIDETSGTTTDAADAAGDSRWAFGTGFEDPLAGVDTSVPPDVDRDDLAVYCLMLGDDALVMSHRLQQWCTNAPELEDEMAIANVGLDLLGQARLLLTRAGKASGSGRGEDDYAFFRAEPEFRNVRLVEAECGDFAHLIAQLLVFASWRLALLQHLAASRDPVLAAIAAKAVKEVTYHRDYAARWAVRLGDGTGESHQRMQAGLAAVWPMVDELFATHEVERRMAQAGVGVDPAELREDFDDVLSQVLRAATMQQPDVCPLAGVSGRTGRHGVHTEAMGYLLAELQSVARAQPEAGW